MFSELLLLVREYKTSLTDKSRLPQSERIL